MTLTQLNVFVLVARLGSVTAAANALSVSESAVSQALTALRQHLGDPLVVRGSGGMTLTPGGTRLLATASQIVALGAEAQAAVRAAQGAPEQLRLVATSTIAEFAVSPLLEAFTRRFSGAVEVSAGVAGTARWGCWWPTGWPTWPSGAAVASDPALQVTSEPVFRYKMMVVAPRSHALRGGPASGSGWSTRPAPTRAATAGSCWPRCACRTAGSGCSPTRPRRGPPPPTARGSPRRPRTWSPSSCAAASCPWSRCRAPRWTRAGT